MVWVRILPLGHSRTVHARPGLRAGLGLLLLGLALGCALPAEAGQSPLPPGVPNIFDRSVRMQFEIAAVVNLRGNPDLPVLVVWHKQADGRPQVLLLALDARNGRQTWSLATDPIVLIVAFASPRTVLGIHVDSGFLERGRASGTYTTRDPSSPLALPGILREVAAVMDRSFL